MVERIIVLCEKIEKCLQNHSHAVDSKETDYTHEYEINVVYEYECTNIIVIIMLGSLG